MAPSATWLLGTASLVACFDLVHKAAAVAHDGAGIVPHPRSALYVTGIALASALWAGTIVLTRSASIAAAGGIVAGGAAGNLASLALWPSVDGVPNPLVAGGIAFNIADVAVAVGLPLILVTALLFAADNRARLGEPVRLRR